MPPIEMHTIKSRLTPSRKIARVFKWLWGAVSVAVALGALLSANGGAFDPRTTSFPAILSMSFPAWIVVLASMAMVTWFISRRLAIGLWIAILLCVPGIQAYCPLNLFNKPKVDQAESHSILNVMTYNTFGFNDDEGIYPNGTNRTASTIISSNADVVFLQEIGRLQDIPGHLPQAQVDSLRELYPYSMFNEEKMVGILSRYPLEWVEMDSPVDSYAGWEAASMTFNDTRVLLVSVHLQSLGLNDEDKKVYHEITSGDKEKGLKDAGKLIYSKVALAAKVRAEQAEILRNDLDRSGFSNVLIAGDFNDINNCYAMRIICGDNLRSTFTDVGRGPTITYHKDRFLFNIDHILYGGNIRPVSIHTGNELSSDHYPVYASFIIGK